MASTRTHRLKKPIRSFAIPWAEGSNNPLDELSLNTLARRFTVASAAGDLAPSMIVYLDGSDQLLPATAGTNVFGIIHKVVSTTDLKPLRDNVIKTGTGGVVDVLPFSGRDFWLRIFEDEDAGDDAIDEGYGDIIAQAIGYGDTQSVVQLPRAKSFFDYSTEDASAGSLKWQFKLYKHDADHWVTGRRELLIKPVSGAIQTIPA